ncbi:MAG: PDDEXK nuclease domain-containing protein [Candidatus Gracilibacteria bacterium]|nr:PDDEXK nuclease domain-containing protein [Candidatus Gracilibacteria bacterium]
MIENKKITVEYKSFLIQIKKEIFESRNETLKTVNKELVNLYFKIGKNISEKITQSLWGKNIVENLSEDLKKDFPGIQGFSKRNIWNMVRFFDFYSKNTKLQPLAAEISWSNNIIILEKCENNFQIEYYLKLSKKTHLSKRVLQNKIESQEFERILSENKTNNFNLTLKEENLQIIKNTIKDSYIFDFLSLGDEYKERELEADLLQNLKKFILELGMGFAYIGNQYNIKVEGNDYFLDMLFYHTKLKCYIIIELKIGEFKPEFIGKLNFYINVVDDKIKQDDDKSTIGLLICKSKNKGIIEYALKGQTNPLAISEYSFENLSEDLKKNLPGKNEINKFLEKF